MTGDEICLMAGCYIPEYRPYIHSWKESGLFQFKAVAVTKKALKGISAGCPHRRIDQETGQVDILSW